VFSLSLLLGRCSLLLVFRRGSRSSHCRFGMVAFLHFATAAAARTFAATARAATAALMATTTARTAARATTAASTATALATAGLAATAATAVREKAAQAATEATTMAAAAHVAATARATAARTTAVATAAASAVTAEPESIRGARNGQHGHDQGNTMKVHLTHLHLRNAFACPRRPPCGGPEDPGQCWTKVGRDARVANSLRFIAAREWFGAKMPVVPAEWIGAWRVAGCLGQRPSDLALDTAPGANASAAHSLRGYAAFFNWAILRSTRLRRPIWKMPSSSQGANRLSVYISRANGSITTSRRLW